DVKLPLLVQDVVHRQLFRWRRRKCCEGHQELGGSDITERLELPFVATHFEMESTLSHLLRYVGKEGVSKFVCDGVPHPSSRSIRIELDPHSAASHRYRSSVTNVSVGNDVDIKQL